jgi:hypothetical protein
VWDVGITYISMNKETYILICSFDVRHIAARQGVFIQEHQTAAEEVGNGISSSSSSVV